MKLTEEGLRRRIQKGSHTRWTSAMVAGALLTLFGSVVAWGILPLPRKHATNGEAVRNYGVVWPGKMMRSGKPYSKDGWTWLHDQGVKSIVTLVRGDHVDYKKFGFKNVLRIPLKGPELPTEEQAKQYLQFIQDPKDWPVDVHCVAGKNRTGMMVALARYAIDGWPMEKALGEAKAYRDGDDLPQYRVAWLQKWAAAHKAGSERRTDRSGSSNAKGSVEL